MSLRTVFHASPAAVLLAAAVSATLAFASPSVSVAPNASAGDILVDDHGMTVYTFSPDQPNSSTCYDGCAQAWPPVLADSLPTGIGAQLAANLSLAPRTDGSQQLAYRGMPLYYFVGDRQPGDTNGQASEGEWFVVTP